MPGQVDNLIRGPHAFHVVRQALDDLERRQIWPTPLNLELWLHYLNEPESPLAKEIDRLLKAGEPFTDSISETLAAFLPRARLNDELRDAGAQLSRELHGVSTAIAAAQKSQEAYGRTLAGAGEGLKRATDAPVVRELVENLAHATQQMSELNASLEKRLQDSTLEINRLRDHLEQVRRDAMTDALTQLANRKAFDEELTRLCGEAAESGAPLTLAVIDIDHFKRFNDTWGHQTGDQVLRFVASVIGRFAAPPRLAARYGGEEFGLIFPGDPASTVETLVNHIREEIGSRVLKRRSTNEDLGEVTISAGVAQFRPGDTLGCLIERADAALYASKRAGRNRVTNAEARAEAA
jgi:diguanylate cyclase